MALRPALVIGARFRVDVATAPSLAERGVVVHLPGRNDADTSSGGS
jgi:hypothetical protein